MIGNLASVKYQIISSTQKLPFVSQHSSHKHLTNNVTQRVHCPAGPVPRGEGITGTCLPKRKLCPPPPPKRELCPKKLTGSVLLKCNSRPETQNTGCHRRISEQERFFRRFRKKHGLLRWLHPKIHENSRMFGNENLFFLVFISEFVKIRTAFEMKSTICENSRSF